MFLTVAEWNLAWLMSSEAFAVFASASMAASVLARSADVELERVSRWSAEAESSSLSALLRIVSKIFLTSVRGA